MLERVWRKGNLPTLYSHHGEEYGGSFRKLKIELPYDPGITLLGLYLEKTIIQKIHAPQCSLKHYLQ